MIIHIYTYTHLHVYTLESANNGHPRNWSKMAVMVIAIYRLIIICEVIWGLNLGGRYSSISLNIIKNVVGSVFLSF